MNEVRVHNTWYAGNSYKNKDKLWSLYPKSPIKKNQPNKQKPCVLQKDLLK